MSASHRGARELGGPVLLLQIWAWEHIHIGRPRISRVRDPPPQFDEAVPILGSQHVPGIDPLAVSWLRVHISRSHTAGGLPYYRDALDHQTDEQMTWQPYTDARLAFYLLYVELIDMYGAHGPTYLFRHCRVPFPWSSYAPVWIRADDSRTF
ncbi:serine/threonine-protein phosphatase 7 long form homolog [Beta vulgaris subsp. vulgaris]|uniref:serine/threonine-protein phosphatase 7 long form homolog n=1 Tax=Beta vulgaris subsp. vulgaris TaxID=3555 RepID=UPI002549192E|nr:serine/threonine-protein phosphatase 7 long form homolog [Beta vulgaris subsp. vulgaris]